ncbi:MAG: aminoacyl-tRNA hydrolase [Arenicellales bacterium]|jgi:PTH1 family peptidyl-tRNA hydrolase|nr:aminoacyl-tRNA hydrolase [Gammaproteobacteria bacterium]NDA15076.1 aminoacyl-tRNA hydrolase [Gammaproteobacteria bacterium]NDG44397.1 aminoacyl-tRNA hydrolase [Gammaproteobacteria bacterium]
MSPISLVAGLGNPGSAYESTRHNAGFWFLDALTRWLSLSWRSESRFSTELADTRIQGARVRVVRPTTFMNESGTPVAGIADYFEIPAQQILVVHDDLDLSPGTVRVKRGGGHGGHNGLRDIFAKLGSRDFVRLRIGIGHPGDADRVTDWVLSRPSAVDRQAMDSASDQALGMFNRLIAGELEAVMQALHTETPEKP